MRSPGIGLLMAAFVGALGVPGGLPVSPLREPRKARGGTYRYITHGQHTNPKRNKERKLLRALGGRRQYREEMRYRAAMLRGAYGGYTSDSSPYPPVTSGGCRMNIRKRKQVFLVGHFDTEGCGVVFAVFDSELDANDFAATFPGPDGPDVVPRTLFYGQPPTQGYNA